MLLRDISLVWSMIHTLVMFIFLFESRFSKRKTIVITIATMIPLLVINMTLAMFVSAAEFGTMILLTMTVPSLIVFWIMAKNRDSRFIFTFCLVDTTVLEIVFITQILNFYITPDSYLFMFISRLIIFPVIEIIVYTILRPMYLEVQKSTKRGWWTFALISALFYVTVTLMMNYPTSILDRPEELPAVILILLLIPSIYVHIFTVLFRQKTMLEMTERDSILQLQVSNIAERAREYSEANDKFRIERHNLRHKMHTIASLVERKQYDELHGLVMEYVDAISETQIKRYCSFTVIDAVLSTYLKKAESKGINVTLLLDLPEELPANEAELGTVFANAIDNATNACEKLPEEERFIKIQAITSPCFMIQISNSFNGEVEFDVDGIPINPDEEHGFGTRSIAAFCEKHNVFFEFKAEENIFSLRLVFGNK